MIVVNRAIVHNLQKEIGDTNNAEIILSETCLASSEQLDTLISKLNNSYIRSDYSAAEFDFTEENSFPHKFTEYTANPIPDSFISFSKSVMGGLLRIIKPIAPARGGYLIFSDYCIDDRHYFSVFDIRNTDRFEFVLDNTINSYTIDTLLSLDLDKLAMACKVNIDQFREAEGVHYLTLVRKGKDEVSDYFSRWISAKDPEKNSLISTNFVQLIRNAKLPVDATGNNITEDEFRQKVFDYVTASKPNPIRLTELSRFIYEDGDYLSNLAEEKKIIIDSVFQPNMSIMKKLIKIDLNVDNIKLRFSYDEFGENKKVDINDKINPTAVIIHSPSLARALLDEV